MPKVCVSILSDDRLFCDGLRRILAADSSLTLTALAEHLTVPAAVRAAGLDVLVVDARMEHAFDLCARVDEEGDGPAIVFVAVPEDDASATRALAAGARGILQKSARWEDLSKAIHIVANGEVWAPRHIIVAAWLSEIKHTRASR